MKGERHERARRAAASLQTLREAEQRHASKRATELGEMEERERTAVLAGDAVRAEKYRRKAKTLRERNATLDEMGRQRLRDAGAARAEDLHEQP